MSSRPPPPQGTPPSYAFVARVYNRSLRPVVLSTGVLTALWTLIWAIGSFRDIKDENNQHFHRLAVLSIVLGSLYITACAIEIFGVIAAVLQRFALVRIYAFLSIVAALLVVACGFLRTIVHFTYKNELITECTNVVTGADVSFRWGIWGPSTHETLTAQEASDWCNNAWSHDSWSEIVSLIIEILLGVLFSAIALAYYRQMLDPTSPVNASRAPSNQVRMNAYPAHYSPPFNASVPTLSYDAPQYAPPPGSPPQDANKPPAYGYGVGTGSEDAFEGAEKDDKDDPFTDFEGTSTARGRERDVTSRPQAGEQDTFHV